MPWMIQTTADDRGGAKRFHVIPLEDLREHERSDDCWCHPDHDNGVVTHAALDGREAFERGERVPS